jgi:polyhydroxybutyrate depolymerase
MSTRVLLLLLVLVLLDSCTKGGWEPDPSPSGRRIPIGRSSHTINIDGRERTYLVYRPATVPVAATTPLVVVLHGAVGTGAQAETSYGWDAEAERGRFLVAYPNGVRRAWAASERCCGMPARANIDDVGFIKKMVAAIAADAPVNARRVYATGISNGAMLAYRLGCDTTLFAAIGPVAGTMVNQCRRPAPLSLIHIHGTADRVIPYGGGPSSLGNGRGRPYRQISGPPVPQLIASWRAIDRCGAPTDETSGVVSTSAATCPDGRAVDLITITGAGHQWPGLVLPSGAERQRQIDPPSRALDATSTIWLFFAAHPKLS